jgi:hypothetical protein
MLRLTKSDQMACSTPLWKVLALVLLMLISPLASTARADGETEAPPTPPTPPTCDKLYVGAEAGLLACNNQTMAGFTVFSATADENIYMIDERGEKRHQWTSTHPNGSGYGLDIGQNGSILHVINDLPADEGPLLMEAGGAATHIEILDANSQLLWEIEEYADEYRLHHDATFLPNGNVLAIAWEYIPQSEALSMGREEDKLSTDGLWPDVVIEYSPNETGGAERVWMWRASDHFIQDQDEMLPTYGDPAEHPEKININAIGPNSRADDADWMHCNSIDYDPVHQHIMLSCRHTEELYIISHNLTWAQSNGSQGDLLFRWGNPMNYDMGSSADHYTVVQHDAHFIPSGHPYAGSISYFSNEMSGPSKVGIITPTRNGDAFVLNKTSGMYDPPQPNVEFTLPAGWGPRFQSGATLLSNGQFLVSHSLRGKIGQIGTDSQIDWEYNLPFNPGGQIAPRDQRFFPPVFFKAEWLDVNDQRLQTLPLGRMGVIESYDDICPESGDDILWDWNGDGCIEDDDQDGVTNDLDWCPKTEPGVDVDEQGCLAEGEEIMGCTDADALNYNPQADVDDGSCEYPPPEVIGCMDEEATNYNPEATTNDPSMCEYPPPEIIGCMDEEATNYNPEATTNDPTVCQYPPPPPPATEGCHDLNATNVNLFTDLHNASLCQYPEPEPEPEPVLGCTNASALNYDEQSEVDDGSCLFSTPEEDREPTETLEPVVEVPCEQRDDCPAEEQTTELDSRISYHVALIVGLTAVAGLLALVLTVQVSRRLYRDD